MTTGRPWRAGVWVPIVAVLAVVFAFVVPWLPSLAATERPVVAGERVVARTASFVPATGWTLNIEAAANSRPETSLGAVTVRLSDGVWFGTSADLVERMGENLREAGATVGQLPDAPSDDALLTLDPNVTAPETVPRAEYLIPFTLDGAEGHLLVVREDATVALLRSVGPAADLTEAADAIHAMAASIDTGAVDVNAVPRDPR